MTLTRRTVVDVVFAYLALGPYAGVLLLSLQFLLEQQELAGIAILIHPGVIALAYTAGLLPALMTGAVMLAILRRTRVVRPLFALQSTVISALVCAGFAVFADEGERPLLGFAGAGAFAGLVCGTLVYLRLRRTT